MELDDFGKKIGYSIVPYGILLTIIDLLLKFGTNLELKDIVFASIIFTIIYVFVWHEFRLRHLERKIK